MNTESGNSFPENTVLVVGAGVSGVCAALQCARSGVRCLLIERSGINGGTLALSGIASPGLFFDWKGRQGEFINVGLDYLYALPVGKRKNIRLEFSLGLGYIHSWVRPYEVKEEFGALVRDPQELRVNWFGPTKLSVSLVVPIHMKVRAGGER